MVPTPVRVIHLKAWRQAIDKSLEFSIQILDVSIRGAALKSLEIECNLESARKRRGPTRPTITPSSRRSRRYVPYVGCSSGFGLQLLSARRSSMLMLEGGLRSAWLRN
jgi:hypothetical protein